jgi:hypothetical protein
LVRDGHPSKTASLSTPTRERSCCSRSWLLCMSVTEVVPARVCTVMLQTVFLQLGCKLHSCGPSPNDKKGKQLSSFSIQSSRERCLLQILKDSLSNQHSLASFLDTMAMFLDIFPVEIICHHACAQDQCVARQRHKPFQRTQLTVLLTGSMSEAAAHM